MKIAKALFDIAAIVALVALVSISLYHIFVEQEKYETSQETHFE